MDYEVTYSTEIVEETWHNSVVNVEDISPLAVADQFNVDLRSRYTRVRQDGRRDHYYRIWIDNRPTCQFLRLRER